MRKVIFVLVVTLAGIFAAFATDRNLTLDELFNKVSHIDRFEVMDDMTDMPDRKSTRLHSSH